jgi:diketogulonate reductase-like aldo/keto reductase
VTVGGDREASSLAGRGRRPCSRTPPGRPNLARFVFLDPASHDFHRDWEQWAEDRAHHFDSADLDSLLPACQVKPMVNQIRWFIGLDPSDTVRTCTDHDIVVEAYSPFAHGLIVNHPEIADIAARYTASAPQLCIRYLLQKGAVVLPKATTTAHIEQNAQLDFEISAADMDVLDAMRDTDSHEGAMEFRWS